MKKNILLSVLFLFSSLSVWAQEEKVRETPVKASEYSWYLGVNAGTQLLFSSDVTNLSGSERFTPAISITAGKWFSPVWGARIQVGGYSLNGFSTTEGLYVGDPLSNGLIYGNNDPVRQEVTIRPDGSYRHYLRYINAHVDFQLSLLNLINKNRTYKWDIMPAVGIGYFRTFDYKGTPATNNISNNFSIMGKYNVYKGLDVNLEVLWSVLPGSFDGRITDKNYESNMAITVGLAYNFKKRDKDEKTSRRKTAVYQYHHVEVVKVRDTVEKVIEKETLASMKREPFTLASIRFGLSKTNPNKGQEVQYVNVAAYLDTNPNARIIIRGYGDKSTGSAEENLRISNQRAENIKKMLIENYSVSPDKIETKAFGAEEQPYEKDSWNRVVIITAIED